jgi:alcohol dehydrogenase class IV
MAKLRLAFPAFQMPAVTTGSGSLRSIAETVEIGDAAFLLSGQAAVTNLLEASLAKAGAVVPAEHRLLKPAGEPSIESIAAGAAFLGARHWTAIVAIGGGSVLDWARLSWARSAGLLDVDRGTMAPAGTRPRPRLVLVPTTCASGAEGASVAVYSRAGIKTPVVSPAFLADRVLLDGRFLASLDADGLSASLSDALSHCIESMQSLVPNGLAKMTAASALRTLLTHADGGIPTASRADRLLEASYLAGVAASHTSVGIAHAFAHAMAAEGVTHGRGNALALGAAVRFNQGAAGVDAVPAAAGLDVAALLDRLRTVTAPARATAAGVTRAVLDDPARRARLAAGMLADVAIRTNPVTADAAGVDSFLALLRSEALDA